MKESHSKLSKNEAENITQIKTRFKRLQIDF